MRCSKCGTESTSGKKFCPECGAPLSSRCAKCGADSSPTAKFCEDCGAPLGVPAAASSKKSNDSPIRVADSPASEILQGERKTVTALFADIKGSTELEQDLDPEEARAIVDPALKLMIDAVHRYDGYVVQSTGDGIFALFGAPAAHEDHPQRALHAALRMQEELKKYSARLRETGNLPLEARVGVNTGEVVVRSITTGAGHAEYTPIGHTNNLASRMQALAPTGSIAISEQTRNFVEGYFQLKPLGPTKVKGVTDPVNVYEVTGLGPLRSRLERAAGRGLSRFVGRQAEMASLKRAAEQAKAGRGQIAAAIAEAGVGKSRLFFEFKAENQSGWMALQAFSVSHGKASAYLPVIDLLHCYFGIDRDDDDSRKRREKVNGKVLTLDRSLEDVLPYLHALLGLSDENNPLAQMDAQVRKRRTLEAIKRILVRESLNQPLILIFEDLHWIDEESQAFLNLLADSIAIAKILLLVNYRPEYHHQWGSKTCYSQLRLDPLGNRSAEEMLSALLGDSAQLAALKKLITEKTEGNPFFMEEMVQVLLDEGALKRDGAAVRLTKRLSELKIPPTVQAILAARIDRLPPDEKDLLQTLAVTGKDFSLSLVREVIKQPDDEINRMLNNLQLAEFIYEQPTAGDLEYTFKHALTQEVAYTSILAERRRALHLRIGVALETLYSQRLDDRVEQLAYHFTRGGNAQKALEYLERAGRRAEERSANTEAVSHFSAALELLRAMPPSPQRAERELSLLLALGPSINVTRGWDSPEVEGVYRRARELCQEAGETPQLLPALFGLAGYYIIRGEYNSAREFTAQNLNLARRTEDPDVLLEAHHYLAAMQTYAGELTLARESQDEVITHYDRKTHHPLVHLYAGDDPAACCLGHKAWTLWLMGYPEQALQTAQAALHLAQELSHPFSLAQATWHNAWLHGVRGERAHAIAQAQAAIALSEDQGFSLFARSARFTESALAADRATTDGVQKIRRSLVQGALLSVCLGALAEACLEGFHFHEAGVALAEAFPIVDKGERIWEAELFRLRGKLKSADPMAAEADFHRALKVARSQNARSLELRATTSLARTLKSTDRRDEARTMLAEIYNWFTEGFDTHDLKEAKSLLDDLSN
jgi:class 3 adenylate cyclase/tetratricopeptide (TPR) repeat protein